MDKLTATISKVKGKASKSEVVGLSVRFAQQNMDEFLGAVLKDLETEPILGTLRNPVEGERTDARRVEEYLYG